jgi:phospholipase/carboxylesterase
MRLHPGLIRRAVLLRAVDVLEEQPSGDLSDAAALIVAGEADPYAPGAEALAEQLRRAGGHVELTRIEAGHALSEADAGTIRAWLAAR